MKISLILAFYRNFDALELIFQALSIQTYKNFEVIIAEDDNNPITPGFLAQVKIENTIKHVFQEEDLGFRKNMILNQAIKISEGDFIVFIDGDCIPHKNFLKVYARMAAGNEVLFGRRVMLSGQLTNELYKNKDLAVLRFGSLFNSKSKKIKYSFSLPIFHHIRKRGIVGANWGLFKNSLVAVNGFDEDYVTAGVGEDNDIEWRLLKYGLKLRSVRFSAVVYHLHHKSNYSAIDTSVGYSLIDKKMKEGHFACRNGLNKL
jgi:GT2 family glycosyltransferase